MFENHPKSRLIKEIKKLPPFKRTIFEKYPEKDDNFELITKDMRKSLRKKEEVKDIIKKTKRNVKPKQNTKILEIKKIVDSLSLSKKEKIKKIGKIINITRKDVY